jgi:hypothetical protein
MILDRLKISVWCFEVVRGLAFIIVGEKKKRHTSTNIKKPEA